MFLTFGLFCGVDVGLKKTGPLSVRASLKNVSRQPLGPPLKVKLLASYRRDCLHHVDAVYSRQPGVLEPQLRPHGIANSVN